MSGYADVHPHPTSKSPATSATSTKPPAHTSPYNPFSNNPAAQHAVPHSSYPADGLPDGLPRPQHAQGNGNVNGGRQGQGAAYASSVADSLTAALQNAPDSQAQQHLHQGQGSVPAVHQHDAAATPQYSTVGHHGQSASPPDHQGPSHAASVSPQSKRNTRIPRACDLCSQRKVKVCFWPCHGTPGTRTDTLPTPVRRWNPSMSTLPRTTSPLHLRSHQETARTSEQSSRGRARTRQATKTRQRRTHTSSPERSRGPRFPGHILRKWPWCDHGRRAVHCASRCPSAPCRRLLHIHTPADALPSRANLSPSIQKSRGPHEPRLPGPPGEHDCRPGRLIPTVCATAPQELAQLRRVP